MLEMAIADFYAVNEAGLVKVKVVGDDHKTGSGSTIRCFDYGYNLFGLLPQVYNGARLSQLRCPAFFCGF